MKKFAILSTFVIFGGLAGCASLTAKLTAFDNSVNKYAPVIGKDLIMVADILVTAECSPATKTASSVATNILKITAPNSKAATNVENALATNVQVADQLCPLVSAIKAGVGTVPAGIPSQVVAVSATTPAS